MEVKIEGQTEWGWKIAMYLFLAGVGAGAYAVGIISAYLDYEIIPKIGVILGFPLVFIGTLFLITDLGVKFRALRVFMNPGTSWIARGTFIISAFMILGAIHLATWIWPFQWLEEAGDFRKILGTINLIFAILTMIYTGVLLGASRPIALWSTAMLPILFLVSALSTGIMVMILVSSIGGLAFLIGGTALEIGFGVCWVFSKLVYADIFLLILELIILAFYLQAMHRTEESRASCQMMLKGKMASVFWLGIIVLGLVIPLSIEIIESSFLVSEFSLQHEVAGKGVGFLIHIEAFTTGIVAAIFGLMGGFLLRYVILACGVKAPLKASGFEFTIPISRYGSQQ